MNAAALTRVWIYRRSWALLARALVLGLSSVDPGSADVFRIISSDQDAAQVRVDMIQRAREEILIELFRASEDRMVLSYLTLLRDAARRGVKVRFLIDGVFNSISKPVEARLVQAGIEIKEYHPVRLTKLRWITRRLHDKMILVDREHMLIGGRNLENPWFGVAGGSFVNRAYLDCDVYVRGKAAQTAHRYFMQLWNSKEVDSITLGPYDPKSLARQCDDQVDEHTYERCEEARVQVVREMQRAETVLAHHKAELAHSTLVHLNPGVDWSANQRDIPEVRFLHDPVGRKGKEPGTFEAFLAYINAADRSVIIESTYLILSKNSKRVLGQAIDRGVRVRVLTNSLASTHNLFAQGGYEGKKKKLVRMGLEIWEYKGPRALHAKTVVVDDKVAIIGNFNLDPRSESLNTELAVVAHDAEVARQLRSTMDAHLANAWLITADGRPAGERRRFPEAKLGKIVKLRFYQLLAPLIKKQL